jgi:hypothetical protein
MNRKIFNKLHTIVPDSAWKAFKNNNAMLAGGAFERILTNNPVNDLDIYFTRPEDVYSTVKALIANKYAIMAKTNRSLLLKNNNSFDNIPINIIYMSFFKDLNAVFDNFDYECCKAGFYFSNNEFVCSPIFWETLQTKSLKYTGSKYPIGALMRLTKYVQRGYTPDYSSVLKLYKDLNALNMVDPETIENQIGGMYGCRVDLKGLSLDQIIKKLDGDEVFEKKPQFIDETKINEIFEYLFTLRSLIANGQEYIVTYCGDTIVNIRRKALNEKVATVGPVTLPITFGKWVEKRADGSTVSFMNKTFQYVLGEVSVGRDTRCGIYVGLETKKYNLTYANSLNRMYCRINLEEADDLIDGSNPTMIQIKKGRVIGLADVDTLPTLSEFVALY